MKELERIKIIEKVINKDIAKSLTALFRLVSYEEISPRIRNAKNTSR